MRETKSTTLKVTDSKHGRIETGTELTVTDSRPETEWCKEAGTSVTTGRKIYTLDDVVIEHEHGKTRLAMPQAKPGNDWDLVLPSGCKSHRERINVEVIDWQTEEI